MSSTRSPVGSRQDEVPVHAFDDAEKGQYEHAQSWHVESPVALVDEKTEKLEVTSLSATSPIHEGLTPLSSALVLQSPDPPANNTAPTKASQPKRRVSRWIIFNLWFNTYRKFFTFVTLLNLTGIILAALDRFPYAKNHLGALVLGNLLFAVLFRNELFLRFLYTIFIYGLRSVRPFFAYSPGGY